MPLACTCNTSALSSENGGNDATLPFDVIPPLPFSSFDMSNNTTRNEDSPRRAMDGGSRTDTPRTSQSRRRRETTVASKEAEPSSINPHSDASSRSHDHDHGSSPINRSQNDLASHPDESSNGSGEPSQSQQAKQRPSAPTSGSELSDDRRRMARNLLRLPGMRQTIGYATRGIAKKKVRRVVARGKAKLKQAFMRAGDDKSSGGARGWRKVKRRTSKAYSSCSSRGDRAAKWVHNQSYRSAGQLNSPRSPDSSGRYSFQLSSPSVGDDSREHDRSLSLSFGSPTLDFSAPDSQSTPTKRGRRVRAPSITESLAYEESQEQWRQSEQSLGMQVLQDNSPTSVKQPGSLNYRVCN